MEILIAFLLTALLGAMIALVIVVQRKQTAPADLAIPLQHLTHMIQQSQGQTAYLTDKLSYLESLPQGMAQTHTEIVRMIDRVGRVEQDQRTTSRFLQQMHTGLTTNNSDTASIARATEALYHTLAEARENLSALQAHSSARSAAEQRTAASIRQLELVMAGTQARGTAGENILEAVFAKLPIEWQVRNFSVDGRRVEFALRLPDSRILPIDSKWAAATLVSEFVSCDDPVRQQSLKRQIEQTVLEKGKDIQKYINPQYTTPFGIAAVPDTVFDLCSGIHVTMSQRNVILINYSMFLPYLLLVFQTTLKAASSLEVEKLDAALALAQTNLERMRKEIDGRYSTGMTMINNAKSEISACISAMHTSLAGIRITTSASTDALADVISNEVTEPIYAGD